MSSITHVIFVLAHPDDESMFFTPTLSHLNFPTHTPLQSHLLCLSTGDYAGLGSVRSEEIQRAATFLNFSSLSVLNTPSLQDGSSMWSPPVVKSAVQQFVDDLKTKTKTKTKASPQDAFVLVTFDELGVSGHTNHVQTFRGVREFLSENKNKSITGYSLLTLRSKSLKYFPPLAMLLGYFRSRHHQQQQQQVPPTISRLLSPSLAYRAMSKHDSQFVWWRKLSTVFSAYSYLNVLEAIDAGGGKGEGEGGEEKWRAFLRETGFARRAKSNSVEDDFLTGLTFVLVGLGALVFFFVSLFGERTERAQYITVLVPLLLPVTLVFSYFNWFGMKLFLRR